MMQSWRNSPALENISHGQLLVVSIVSTDEEGGPIDAVAGSPCSIFESLGNRHFWSRNSPMPPQPPRNANEIPKIILPCHAGWFAMDKVNKLERQSMPQFFFGKSKLPSPMFYMEVRNRIIYEYRQNPHRSISIADISGLNGMEDKDLCRILDFLSHWGFVNYQARTDNDKTSLRHRFKAQNYMEENSAGEIQKFSLQLSPLEVLYQFDSLRAPPLVDCTDIGPSSNPASLVIVKEVQGVGTGYFCNACGANCSSHRYVHKKKVDYVLCPSCYGDGTCGIGVPLSEFTPVDADSTMDSEHPPQDSNHHWTEQETLTLLEALEIFGDNWAEVSEFVGTKSKAQCIEHFIGLPIEEQIFEEMEVPKGFLTQGFLSNSSSINTQGGRMPSGSSNPGNNVTSNNRHGLGSDESITRLNRDDNSNGLMAFAGAGNPVMTLVAFVGAVIGPRAAATVAHSALLSLANDQVLQSCSGGRVGEEAQGQSTHRLASNMNLNDNGGVSHDKEESLKSISGAQVIRATTAGMAAAAVKSKQFADQEDREIQRLSAFVVDHQLKKINLKLKELEEIDATLLREGENIEKNRQRVAAERARYVETHSSSNLPQNVVSIAPSSLNLRPTGSVPASAVSSTVLAAAVHSSGMPRSQTMYALGPGGVPVPISSSMNKLQP